MKPIQTYINVAYDECFTRFIQYSKTTTQMLCYFNFIEANPDAGTIVFQITDMGQHLCVVRINTIKLNDTQTTLTAQFFEWGQTTWDNPLNHIRVKKLVNKIFDNISKTYVPQELSQWNKLMRSKHGFTVMCIIVIIVVAFVIIWGYLSGRF